MPSIEHEPAPKKKIFAMQRESQREGRSAAKMLGALLTILAFLALGLLYAFLLGRWS